LAGAALIAHGWQTPTGTGARSHLDAVKTAASVVR
jgi:hypothetical protein